MPNCAIITCSMKSQTSGIKRGGISFHRFPREPNARERWIDVTGRNNWMPTKSSTICSKHFNENDFIIKKSGNRYLKSEAIPTELIVQICSHSSVTAANPIPSTSSTLCKEEPQEETEQINTLIFEISDESTPTKERLEKIISSRDYVIQKQRQKIKKVQSQNRRLKRKIKRFEDIMKQLEEKFSIRYAVPRLMKQKRVVQVPTSNGNSI